MEQSACQVHVVLIVQNHQLQLTNNPLACLIRSAGGIYNVCVQEYYIIPHAFVLYTCIVVVITAHLLSLMMYMHVFQVAYLKLYTLICTIHATIATNNCHEYQWGEL